MSESALIQANDDNKLTRDPEDRIWYDSCEMTRPPMEAYRYFPIGGDLRNKGQRFVYGGNTVYDQEEEEKYSVLEQYLEEHKEELKEVPEDFYQKPEILKITWAVKFKKADTIKAMVDYYKWR